MKVTFNADTVVKIVWHHRFKRLKRQNGETVRPTSLQRRAFNRLAFNRLAFNRLAFNRLEKGEI
jgi:hypothetical protein